MFLYIIALLFTYVGSICADEVRQFYCCSATNDFLMQMRDTLTDCCATLQQDFNGTWTIFNEMSSNSQNQSAQLGTTIVDCCTSLHNENVATWAILNTLEVDIGQDFAGTWTVLADLQSNVSQIVNATTVGPITITGIPYTISNSGMYCLTVDAATASGVAITINTDDVVLDLCNHTLANIGSATIGIDAQSLRNNIVIKNGLIKDFTSYGIAIGSGTSLYSQNVTIEGITAIDCGTGILYAGTQDGIVEDCNCYFCDAGIVFDGASRRCRVESGIVNDAQVDAGLTVTGSSTDITIKDCEFHRNNSSGIVCRNSATFISVLNCICNSNVRNGIEITTGVSNCLLLDNEVFGNTLFGIDNNGSNNQIFRNIARANGSGNFDGVSLIGNLLGLGAWDNLSL